MCVLEREYHHAYFCRRRRAARGIYNELYSGGGVDESIVRCHCAKYLEGVSPVFMHDDNDEMGFILYSSIKVKRLQTSYELVWHIPVCMRTRAKFWVRAHMC